MGRFLAIIACVACAWSGWGQTDGELALCDYFPLAEDNQWDTRDSEGGVVVVRVETAPELATGPQWELVSDPAQGAGRVFVTYFDGVLRRIVAANAPTLGPDSDAAWEAWLPAAFTPETPVTLPGGASVTALQGSLSELLVETGDTLDPADFAHGDVADAVVFVDGEDVVSPYFGRDLGILFADNIVTTAACPEEVEGEGEGEGEGDAEGEGETEGEPEGEPEGEGEPEVEEVPNCEGNRVLEGSFEAGTSGAAWTLRPLAGAARLYENPARARSGRWFVEFTGQSGAPSSVSLEQTLTLPAYSTGTLRFAIGKPTSSGNGSDGFEVFLGDQRLAGYGEGLNLPPGSYQTAQFALPGTTEPGDVTLRFTATGTGAPRETVWLLDDVCLVVTPRTSGDCGLTDAFLKEPSDGARVYLSEDRPAQRLALEASTNCPERTDAITFFLGKGEDRRLLNTATTEPFTATLPLSLLTETGEFFVEVEASGEAANGDPATAQGSARLEALVIDASNDANGDGLPDQPFVALSGTADRWLAQSRRSAGDGLLLSYAAPLRAPVPGDTAPADRVITLDSPETPGQRVVVTVPGALLNNEIGVLLVQIATDLDSLLGDDEAERLATEPTGRFGDAGQYLHVSLLVSASGGADFQEIAPSRLATLPIRVRFEGLPLSGEGSYFLATHRTLAGETDGVLAFSAGVDVWRSLAAQTADPANGVLFGDLTTLGVVGPYGATDIEGEDPDGGGPGILLLILAALGVLQLADGSPCFIATAAYGTPLAAELGPLRAARDTWLLSNPVGTALVDAYYRLSPPLADIIAQQPILAAITRVLLVPVIVLAQVAQAWPLSVWLTAALGLAALRTLTRRRAP